MSIMNIVESFGYAIVKFIIYTVLFSLIYGIIFGTDNMFNTVLMWCFPIGLGMFLGYLGGRSFSFLVEMKNVLLLSLVVVVMNVCAAVLVRKVYLGESEWVNTTIFSTIALLWGIFRSIKDGLKANIAAKENESSYEDNNES